MIRVLLAKVLNQQGWTPYRLAKEAGLPKTAVYRLARAEGGARRIDLTTLDAICRVLGVQPGELLEYVPDRKRGR